ncbi:hypothetical protein Hypma_003879 [Hypsizygus marmoreus]|uniref:Uncharacterized protein n=1 Tax=Hypsizygus marmoreus TaxID=39966 RepID=A0A369K449_HYPMA|nr:hypothetical protein Hypma_003879 [Hypsizygus marmoreus]
MATEPCGVHEQWVMRLGEREYKIGMEMDVGPNRHDSNAQCFSNLNYHHRSSPPPPPPPFHAKRDLTSSTRHHPATSPATTSSLGWRMDEEYAKYAKQVCALMGWDPVSTASGP